MTLRNLMLSLALASVACTLDLTPQIPCKTPGAGISECPGGQTCGSDLLCREVVASCPKNAAGVDEKQCDGNCVDITKDPFNCGGCGSASATFICKAGEQCLADAQGVPHCTTYC